MVYSNYEIIIYYFQIVLKIARVRIRIQGLLDPDPNRDFRLDPDPDSIEYGSETLFYSPNHAHFKSVLIS